ncbi:hypothetical protein IP88_13140 [alpha proteobacterium AAP81b]|nr:hypothetical protein IP88_13140 [alpha proteobacterium AAP81b]
MQMQVTKTARLTVLLAPADKAGIEARAAALKLSVGEFVRRAADAYDPAVDPALLAAMVDEYHATVTAMRDRVAAALDYAEARDAERRALRGP